MQLRHEHLGDYLVFGDYPTFTYHAQLLKCFCASQAPAWAFALNEREDDGVLSERAARVLGGGMFDIDEERRCLSLSGSSRAYGDYEAFGLEEQLLALPNFRSYSIFC